MRPIHPFWPKGLPHAIHVPRVPLTHYLDVAAARTPEKPAILYAGSVLAYARLHARVQALAGYLRQRAGVAQGDRVLLLSQNCPQFTTAFYGVLRAGAAAVPSAAMRTETSLGTLILRTSDPSPVNSWIQRSLPTGEALGSASALLASASPVVASPVAASVAAASSDGAELAASVAPGVGVWVGAGLSSTSPSCTLSGADESSPVSGS